MNNNLIFLRIILSPFIFLWGIFLLAAGTLFPVPLLVLISMYGLICTPFIWLIKKSKTNIKYPEPFLSKYGDYENEKNIMRDHLFGATIYLWGAFAVVYNYIKTGEIFTGE